MVIFGNPFWKCLAAILLIAAGAAPALGFEVTDIFGRPLNGRGLTLVDWEGYMANPAIQFFVKPPPDISFPATATLTAPGARLYFDLPCSVGPEGAVKTISFPNAETKIPVFLSIFPDRDGVDEDYILNLRLDATGAGEDLPVHVVDQDLPQTELFEVVLNFDQDKTGFFNDPRRRAVVEQAARDWAYFLGDLKLDLVPAGAEQTFIWNTNGFVSGAFVRNPADYRGFLLYTYGIHSDALRSGGDPSRDGFQQSGGVALPLRRSGGFEAETAGNFNELGWFLTSGDEDWSVSGNLGNEPNDFYSIAHHEIGHALFFNPGHTLFSQFKSAGQIGAAPVVAYHGKAARIDSFDHFDGEIDNASLRGAFGYEYYGSVPAKRWLPTKLDLLNAQAIGYTLRPVSAFASLAVANDPPPSGAVSIPYSFQAKAGGGIPFYFFEVSSGTLPKGLSLDSFSGKISGSPASAGSRSFQLRVRDYSANSPGVVIPLKIEIASAPSLQFAPASVAAANGVFQARLDGPGGQTQVIEASTNLSSWAGVATNLSGTAVFNFTDPTAGLLPFRFYRAKLRE